MNSDECRVKNEWSFIDNNDCFSSKCQVARTHRLFCRFRLTWTTTTKTATTTDLRRPPPPRRPTPNFWSTSRHLRRPPRTPSLRSCTRRLLNSTSPTIPPPLTRRRSKTVFASYPPNHDPDLNLRNLSAWSWFVFQIEQQQEQTELKSKIFLRFKEISILLNFE